MKDRKKTIISSDFTFCTLLQDQRHGTSVNETTRSISFWTQNRNIFINPNFMRAVKLYVPGQMTYEDRFSRLMKNNYAVAALRISHTKRLNDIPRFLELLRSETNIAIFRSKIQKYIDNGLLWQKGMTPKNIRIISFKGKNPQIFSCYNKRIYNVTWDQLSTACDYKLDQYLNGLSHAVYLLTGKHNSSIMLVDVIKPQVVDERTYWSNNPRGLLYHCPAFFRPYFNEKDPFVGLRKIFRHSSEQSYNYIRDRILYNNNNISNIWHLVNAHIVRGYIDDDQMLSYIDRLTSCSSSVKTNQGILENKYRTNYKHLRDKLKTMDKEKILSITLNSKGYLWDYEDLCN